MLMKRALITSTARLPRVVHISLQAAYEEALSRRVGAQMTRRSSSGQRTGLSDRFRSPRTSMQPCATSVGGFPRGFWIDVLCLDQGNVGCGTEGAAVQEHGSDLPGGAQVCIWPGPEPWLSHPGMLFASCILQSIWDVASVADANVPSESGYQRAFERIFDPDIIRSSEMEERRDLDKAAAHGREDGKVGADWRGSPPPTSKSAGFFSWARPWAADSSGPHCQVSIDLLQSCWACCQSLTNAPRLSLPCDSGTNHRLIVDDGPSPHGHVSTS